MQTGDLKIDNELSWEKYSLQSRRYLDNAYKSISDGNYDKASEFLWGATAQMVKAVAATKGIRLKSHRDLWNYIEQLAKELNDKSIFDGFFVGNSLHGNFYEVSLGRKEVVAAAEDVKEFIYRLSKLLPPI